MFLHHDAINTQQSHLVATESQCSSLNDITSTWNHGEQGVCDRGFIPGGDRLQFGKVDTRDEFTGADGRRRPAPLTARGRWAACRRSGRRRWTQTLTLHLVQTFPVLVILGKVLHETWQAGEGYGETQRSYSKSNCVFYYVKYEWLMMSACSYRAQGFFFFYY